MDIKAEILDYINRKEFTGALLLTGQWGCGKTHLIKAIAKELNESKSAAIAVISLFGLDSISAINKRVKDEYTGFLLGSFGKTAKKISKALATVAKDGMSVASLASGGISGLSAASQGLSSIMTYDLLGFIDVKNKIGKEDKELQFVIVFDDLERNNIAKKDLLGAINEYVENKCIKVIVVADQDRINGDEYKEYKEKLISRTIRMSAEYETLIDGIIDQYCETAKDYKAFLADNQSQLKQVFFESKSNNLRTLKSAIADFERVYDAWKESGVTTVNMKWALYTFTADLFISKAPSKEKPVDKKNNWFGFDKNDDQYSDRGKNKSFFSAFHTWIHTGVWDKEAFIRELKEKYAEADDNSLERFLHYNFWSLEQKDIDEGLPAAITLAYEGKLTSTDLISLIVNVYYLKFYSIQLPCIIDYERIESGFRSRMLKIKEGSIIEPKRHTFATHDQMEQEAFHVYELIEKLDDTMAAWENRRIFMEYLSGESILVRSKMKGLYIEEFDNEMLSAFKVRYSQSNNADREEYARALLDLVFNFSTYSSEENILKTRQNFEALAEWLKTLSDEDAITMLINRLFVEHINSSEIMKTK